MRNTPNSQSDAPIRLFESDVLEAFTHIGPGVAVAIWAPVASWFLWRAASSRALTPLEIASGVLLGMTIWSFTEYAMHRFVFHFEPKTRGGRLDRLLFLVHGIHHVQPQAKSRLVMPPLVSVPLAFGFLEIFTLAGRWLGRSHWVDAAFAGFVVGYLCYDLMHYATHHRPMRRGVLKRLKRNHMQHHYRTPGGRFGVSSPAWEVVFGTYPTLSDPGDTRTRQR